jgi:hypothetical protein
LSPAFGRWQDPRALGRKEGVFMKKLLATAIVLALFAVPALAEDKKA